MTKCCAPFCESNKPGTTYVLSHGFPKKDPELRKKWLKAVGWTHWEPSQTASLCTKHFEKSQYVPEHLNLNVKGKPKTRPSLLNTAVPTIFTYRKPAPGYKELEKKDRHKHATKIRKETKPTFSKPKNIPANKDVENIVTDTESEVEDTDVENIVTDKESDVLYIKHEPPEVSRLEKEPENIRKCTNCDFESELPRIFKRHMNSLIECSECPKVFCGRFAKRKYESHQNKHSIKLSESKKKIPFMCVHCNKQFPYKATLKQHLVRSACGRKTPPKTILKDQSGEFRQMNNLEVESFQSTQSVQPAQTSAVFISKSVEDKVDNKPKDDKPKLSSVYQRLKAKSLERLKEQVPPAFKWCYENLAVEKIISCTTIRIEVLHMLEDGQYQTSNIELLPPLPPPVKLPPVKVPHLKFVKVPPVKEPPSIHNENWSNKLFGIKTSAVYVKDNIAEDTIAVKQEADEDPLAVDKVAVKVEPAAFETSIVKSEPSYDKVEPEYEIETTFIKTEPLEI